MAQSSAASSYNMVGNREDLTNIIATITMHKTPLFSGLQKTRAYARTHEWQTDTLTTGSDNAQIEGADFSFTIPGARTRVVNYTQIFKKEIEVSDSQREFSVAGVEDEFKHQLDKRMKEIATDVEKALITGTGNSGASGTARRLKGILSFITTNVTTGTGTANEALTESMFLDCLQNIWASGGQPETVHANGWQKRKISSFSTSNTRFISMDDANMLKNTVSAYDSDFGRLAIHLNSFMDTDKVAILEKDRWAVAVARDMKVTDVAKIGDSTRAAVVGELTLEARNEASSGQIKELSTS